MPVVLITLMTTFTFAPVVVWTHLVMYQLFGALSLIQKDYNEQLINVFKIKRLDHGEEGNGSDRIFEIRMPGFPSRPDAMVPVNDRDIDNALNIGMDIQSALKALCKAFDQFAFTEVASDIYTAVAGVYLFLLMFLNASYDPVTGELKELPRITAIYALSFAIQATLRYINKP